MTGLAQRINIITLGVADVAAATAFYERLGWRKSGASQPDITFMRLGNLVLSLFSREALAHDANLTLPEASAFNGMTLAINLPSEAEVDAAMDHAAAAGAKILKSPQKVFWGGYSGYFADPDGHAFELAYNPFFPLDENGLIVLPD